MTSFKMPFVSKKQMKKFAQLVKDGEMPQATYDRWEKETDMANLPEAAPKQWSNGATIIRRPRAARGTK